MSYDISFKVKVESIDRYVEVGSCDASTTWNVKRMIQVATGLEWLNCCNNGRCSVIVPKIERGLYELTFNAERYKCYEAVNGWGTVETTAKFFEDIIIAWKKLLKEDKELAKVATFWIE